MTADERWYTPPPSRPDARHPGDTVTDPDKPCPHENFDAYVEVNRHLASEDDSTVVAYSADIKVVCHDCDEPFRWTGVQAGLSPHLPMCSVDETELRAPMRPSSADPDFGLSLPGFAVDYVPAGREADPVKLMELLDQISPETRERIARRLMGGA